MFYQFARGLLNIVFRMWYSISIVGREKEPPTGSLIVAANHHSALDPIFVGIGIRRRLRFMAKVELFKYPGLRSLFRWLGAFPVNRGKGDSKAIRSALEILKNNEVLAMFPEGTRVRPGEAREAQGGIALLASRTGTPVLPVRVVREKREVQVRIGEALSFPTGNGSKPTRDDLHNFSQELMKRIRNL